MYKVAGCILVLSGGLLARWIQLQEYRRRMAALDALIFSLRRMETEIRVNLLPLPELIANFEHLEQKDVQAFFSSIHRELMCGKSPSRIIPQLAAGLPIPKRCQEILGKLGESLRGDEVCTTKAIHLAVCSLEEENKQLADNRRQEQQRMSVCTMSAAALLIILLI